MKTEELKKIADEFIKKCNVFPAVHAKEGGIIDLPSLLIDFLKYVEDFKTITKL